MINYAIPGLYKHYKINKQLLNIRQNNPEFFYPNINIEAVYGVFPWCIFDGGRIYMTHDHASLEEIKTILFEYHKFNVASRLVYTNCQLTSDNYTNRFGNLCLSLCNEYENNQVVVVDDSFLTYIHNNYPNLSFISSTTKCLNQLDFQQELGQSKFIEVCLDYNLNHNWKLLDSLTEEQKKKCEFLCNAICPAACPTRKQHYILNSQFNLNFGKHYTVPYCGIKYNTLAPEIKKYSNNIITYEEIRDTYEPKGFCHFKLEGRTFSSITQTLIYANYMIKPEYKGVFIDYMLKK